MTHTKTAAVIIIIAMLFSLVLTYASAMTTISRAREDTQRVLDSFCIEKAEEIYNSIKNGHNYMISGTYTDEFMGKIATELGLERAVFQYTNPLTANLHGDTLSLTTGFEVVMPLNFAGKSLLSLRVPMQVQSLYVLK